MDLKVSIILPNYNHEKFLEKRLNTIFNQTFQNFEVIILDDKSSDNSIEILNKYKNHPKVSHFVVNNKNSGSPFIQWKKGIELAKYNLIWISESDDFSENTFLEKVINYFNLNNNLSLVFCNTIISNLIYNNEKILNLETKSGIYNNQNNQFLYNWFFENSEFKILNASACVFKKKYINQEVLNKITKHKYSGDKFFWASLLINNNIFGYIDQPLNIQTFHQNTTRSKYSRESNNTRNNEILEIYSFCGFLNLKDTNIKRKNDIGIRLIMKSLYNFNFIQKNIFYHLLKGLFMIKWNKKNFGKIYRLLKLEKN